jgi:hypothetical protein
MAPLSGVEPADKVTAGRALTCLRIAQSSHLLLE